MRQLCDLAEVALLARMEANERFQLLRVMAAGLGAKGLDNYETPDDRLADLLDELATGKGAAADDRRALVLAAVLDGGGEVA